jgi:hypothetical protein
MHGACGLNDTACTKKYSNNFEKLKSYAKQRRCAKKIIKNACGVNDTAYTIFAFENRSYLGKFEAELKKALAVNQGPRGYCLMKKTEGRKSRDTVPLREISLYRTRT